MDGPLCITCGWRRQDVSPEVHLEVEAHTGMEFIEGRYRHKQIGTGKPPLSDYLKTAENAEFAENLLLIYSYLSGLRVLRGEF